MSRNSILGGCNKPVPLLQGQPWSCQKPQHGQCCCSPMQGALFSPTLHALYCSSVFHRCSHPLLGQASRARQGHCACLSSFKLPTFSPALFFFIKIFQKGKKNPCPFPVPPCHVPKVLTNLQCPACTQPPLIAPAFSSGVSSAIATAAPPPPGNSHLHYHSLLQSCPQAPGSEQQLR